MQLWEAIRTGHYLDRKKTRGVILAIELPNEVYEGRDKAQVNKKLISVLQKQLDLRLGRLEVSNIGRSNNVNLGLKFFIPKLAIGDRRLDIKMISGDGTGIIYLMIVANDTIYTFYPTFKTSDEEVINSVENHLRIERPQDLEVRPPRVFTSPNAYFTLDIDGNEVIEKEKKPPLIKGSEESLPYKVRSDYRVGAPFQHDDYGTGNIVSAAAAGQRGSAGVVDWIDVKYAKPFLKGGKLENIRRFNNVYTKAYFRKTNENFFLEDENMDSEEAERIRKQIKSAKPSLEWDRYEVAVKQKLSKVIQNDKKYIIDSDEFSRPTVRIKGNEIAEFYIRAIRFWTKSWEEFIEEIETYTGESIETPEQAADLQVNLDQKEIRALASNQIANARPVAALRLNENMEFIVFDIISDIGAQSLAAANLNEMHDMTHDGADEFHQVRADVEELAKSSAGVEEFLNSIKEDPKRLKHLQDKGWYFKSFKEVEKYVLAADQKEFEELRSDFDNFQGESIDETDQFCEACLAEYLLEYEHKLEEAEYRGRKVSLGKPFLTPGGPKKRSVYVKNAKGNVVKVNFGDPNMKIKKSNPKRRKSFRARHNCSNPGPRWKARYWSCRAW